MDIRQILYFKSVADCGSFAKASERLHISQPAISIQIGQLEAELNAELLVRHARGVRLTEAGRVFLDHSRDILARLDQARAAVSETADEVGGSVTIAMITTIANVVTGPLLERTKCLYPKLDLKICEALSGEISTWHAGGRFDLSIMYLPDPHSMKNATHFMEEALYLLGPIDPAKEPGQPVRFRDLKALPIHHTSRLHACRLLLDSTASREDVDLNIVAEVDSITLLYEFVVRKGAYTIFPGSAKPPVFQREVDYRRIIDPELTLRSYLAIGPERPKSKAISAVVKVLRNISDEISASCGSPAFGSSLVVEAYQTSPSSQTRSLAVAQ
jgi:LysR family nitrogen assimilation transcriptional regulator